MRCIRWMRAAFLVLLAGSFAIDCRLEAAEAESEVRPGRPVEPAAHASVIRLPTQVVGFRDVAEFGLVFVDGRFLEPPYEVQVSGLSLTINGIPVSGELYDDGEFANDGDYLQLVDGSVVLAPGSGRSPQLLERDSYGRSARSQMSQGVPLRRVAYRGETSWAAPDASLRILESDQNQPYAVQDSIQLARIEAARRASLHDSAMALVDSLHDGAVLVVFGDHPITIVVQASRLRMLFETLISNERESEQVNSIVALAATDGQKPLWREWLASYQAPPMLASTLRFELEGLDLSRTENERQVAAVRRLDRYAYPLTVIGMLLGAFALGHMLRSSWTLQQPQVESQRPAAIRATELSLLFVVGMSLFDLTWTILAHQAGQMRELNPLGAGLIKSPEMLVAFKLVATLIGCGILYRFRSHVRCQTASWWMCLVCVLLTFRWVVLDYMFVA